ncbi:MAG: GlsB/YeaQ/YmgE family stress response membrane protein [Spirulina sp.]
MDTLTRLLVQVLIAIVCATLANLLVPRRVPGKAVGLVIIGLAGVFLGEWVLNNILRQYNLTFPWLTWSFMGVPILPSVVGSMIVLYVVSAFLSWGRYGNR